MNLLKNRLPSDVLNHVMLDFLIPSKQHYQKLFKACLLELKHQIKYTMFDGCWTCGLPLEVCQYNQSINIPCRGMCPLCKNSHIDTCPDGAHPSLSELIELQTLYEHKGLTYRKIASIINGEYQLSLKNIFTITVWDNGNVSIQELERRRNKKSIYYKQLRVKLYQPDDILKGRHFLFFQ